MFQKKKRKRKLLFVYVFEALKTVGILTRSSFLNGLKSQTSKNKKFLTANYSLLFPLLLFTLY